ncbi:MAG: BTAD domain-containing putative transcriptional regulator [Jatrophihabitans sp.]|uniref:BTAD domain-containing putative transcriptional regulator n=1 Tax=Jatrophihabitans sp. TaxID=1932789 RepID=UPI003912572F
MRLFGRFAVVRDGREVPAAEFGGRKVRTLLRILATRRGTFVSHDSLTELLWGDRPPADPAANVQVLVNRARRALDDSALVLTGPGGYAMASGDRWAVDTERFLDAVGAARAVEGSAALDRYARALDLWRGEPLAEDAYNDWADDYRRQLHAARQAALEEAAQLALAHGELGLATEFAGAAAAAEPLREPAVLPLIRALAAVGDAAGALTRYDQFRRTLSDELGIDPSDEAKQLHAQLLRGGGSSVAAGSVQRAQTDLSRLRFVGRDVELRALEAALAQTNLAFLIGASGAGKSRLLEVLASRRPLVQVRAYPAEQDEPWSLARALIREIVAGDTEATADLPASIRGAIGWLVPDIDTVQRGRHPDPESRKALLVEGALRLVAGAAPALVIDDLQWADAASLALLDAVLARRQDIGVVLAFRPLEAQVREELVAFLDRLAPRAVEIGLRPLSPADLAELAGDDELVHALSEATDGTPLAVVEVLRSLARRGAVTNAADGRWRPSAPDAAAVAKTLAAEGQRRAIATRVATQPGPVQEILILLSLLAREAPAGLLATVVARDQSAVLADLDLLDRAGLARLGERGWAPAHDMIGEVVAARLTDAARMRLHARLADALERANADYGERARHWLGARDAQRAARAYEAAARDALDAFADAEAIAMADAGLAAAGSRELEAALHEARAEARARRGDIGGARADLRAALQVHRNGAVRARLLSRLATLASGADDLVRAAELAELALLEAGPDEAARARALEIAAVLDMNLDRATRAEQRSDEALQLYQRLGDSQGTARVLDARAMATFLDGRIGRGTELLRRVADLFEDSGDLVHVMTPRSTAGHGLVFADDAGTGLLLTNQALELARTLGHPEGQTYALWHSAEALAALGRVDEGLAAGTEALAIARDLEHRGWTATAWRAVGVAHHTAGDLDAALEAFEQSRAVSEHLNLFASWAASRCALVLVALGRLEEARPHVARGLAEGPPLAHYEARLAEVELAAASADTATTSLAREALRLADAAGMRAGRQRLVNLVGEGQ